MLILTLANRISCMANVTNDGNTEVYDIWTEGASISCQYYPIRPGWSQDCTINWWVSNAT